MKTILNSNTVKFNKEKFNLGKLHSDKYPIMYLFFREYLQSTSEQITINNYKEFVNWFNLNQHKLDYDEIYKNIINSNLFVSDLIICLFNSCIIVTIFKILIIKPSISYS